MNDFYLTAKYDTLIRGSQAIPIGLYQLHIATAEQLCRLHYSPRSIKMVKARLKVLTDQGYIQADRIPTKHPSSPYYYTLGQKGMEYVERAGFDINEAWRASKEIDKHALFISHTLELNDLLIAAVMLRQDDPRFYLHSFMHERVLKHHPYHAAWNDNGKRQVFTVIPDAFLDFRYFVPEGGQRRMPVLLEHDRGTEGQQYFKKRIRAYITLIKTEAYTQLFNTKAITIAFTTFVGVQRLEQIRTWTRQELASTNEPRVIGLVFWFAALPHPILPTQAWLEPTWHTPYEDGEQASALLAA